MKINIELEKKDIYQLIEDSLPNGLAEMRYSGVILNQDNPTYRDNYKKAKQSIIDSGKDVDSIYFETIIAKMMDFGGIPFRDVEGGDDEDMMLTYDMAFNNLCIAIEDDFFRGEVLKVLDPKNWDADGYTYWHILQGALYKQIIFG